MGLLVRATSARAHLGWDILMGPYTAIMFISPNMLRPSITSSIVSISSVNSDPRRFSQDRDVVGDSARAPQYYLCTVLAKDLCLASGLLFSLFLCYNTIPSGCRRLAAVMEGFAEGRRQLLYIIHECERLLILLIRTSS